MTTKEFCAIAPRLAKTGLIRAAKKGEHHPALGRDTIGSTDYQNQKLWKEYGTLENIIVSGTYEAANDTLELYGITEFVAKPTKSGTMCRLHLTNKTE